MVGKVDAKPAMFRSPSFDTIVPRLGMCVLSTGACRLATHTSADILPFATPIGRLLSLWNGELIKSKQQNQNIYTKVQSTSQISLHSSLLISKQKTNMKIIVASFALVYATTSTAFASSHSCNDLDYSYPNDLPWVNYQGEDYIFTRQKYNSVCVDSHNREYEYGTIPGVYTPIDEAGGGCSTFCVEGTSSDSARGCNLRPPSNKLVGFQYDCESATCKCLYEAGTLNNQYSRCFDDMNTSNKGNGQVSGTKGQQGETCYSVHIQSTDPPVGGICTYEPDWDCYKTGHPQCCSVDGGANCHDYLTMCDNYAEGMSGTDYCTNSPEYQCYNTYNGHPSCCSETGGPFMNCPKTQPACDGASQYVKYLRSNK